MEKATEQTKCLKDKCPTCGNNLYAYWHTSASDHPEIGNWHVECSNSQCKYEYCNCFADLEDVSKKFNV